MTIRKSVRRDTIAPNISATLYDGGGSIGWGVIDLQGLLSGNDCVFQGLRLKGYGSNISLEGT